MSIGRQACCIAALLAVNTFYCHALNEPGAPSKAPAIGGTFLQLLAHHGEWEEGEWGRLFDEFESLKLSRIVVQWTVSADLAFYRSQSVRYGKKPPLETILELADRKGMRVSVGLWHDPAYWQSIQASPPLVEVYLRRSRLRSVGIAEELAALAKSHRSFEGWYITEEVDDTSWNDPPRRRLLTEHLELLSAALHQLVPDKQVGLSCFSNATLDPRSLEDFWVSMLGGSRINELLFQDGIGAHKLELSYLPLFLGAMRRAATAAGRELAVIVEVYEQADGGEGGGSDFRAEPAPIGRIEQQIALAAEHGSEEIVAFSVPDYMTAAAGQAQRHLLEAYVKRYLKQEPKQSIARSSESPE